ncbi:tyrosine-type recombinase/integrase [Flavobacterium sp. CYK-55]|uniref:tyrosine-type recombinase/integrase n=1 Tax=Flavobacterium sp. CYK-55 TaxID=2835529 RepID=UPI001BD18566|nr:tyrosine-type recombinase/integrase [Flavobacterium sp. CYK-55]MBS7785680.1 tyrosine-type recombinase/integrase [Flavobacterium sp. CYK-55]
MDNFKQAFQDYLLLEKKYSVHTVNGYCVDIAVFEAFLKQEFDQNTLVDVHYPQIRSWIVQMVESGMSNVSVNRRVASLKSYYKFLLKIGQIQASPLLKHQALKSPKKLQIPFSEKEVDLVLNNIQYPEGFDGVRDKLIIDLFYTTGIRRSELINLQMSGVDVVGSTIKVLGKRNKERIIPILPVIIVELKKYLSERSNIEVVKDSGFFFLSKKGVKLNDSFVYRLINHYFSNVSEKAKKSPHILRHTFATHMLNHGADINSVKELLGHSSLASTQVYTHSSLAELKKVYGNAHPRNRE